MCSDMEGEKDPSVKSSGQEGQSNNFRNGEIAMQIAGRRRTENCPFQTVVSLSCCFNDSQTAKSR